VQRTRVVRSHVNGVVQHSVDHPSPTEMGTSRWHWLFSSFLASLRRVMVTVLLKHRDNTPTDKISRRTPRTTNERDRD